MMELWDAYNEKREQLGHHLIRGQVIGDKESITYQAGETDAHMWVTPADLSNFCEEHSLFNHQKKCLIKLLKKNG